MKPLAQLYLRKKVCSVFYFSQTRRYDSGCGLQSGHSSKQSLPSFSAAKINAVPLQVGQTNNPKSQYYMIFLT